MPCDGSFQYSSAPVSFWQISFAPKEHNSTTCRDALRNCGLSGKETYRIRIPHSSGKDARWRMLAHTTVQDCSVLLLDTQTDHIIYLIGCRLFSTFHGKLVKPALSQLYEYVQKKTNRIYRTISHGQPIGFSFDQLYSPKGRHNNKIKKNRKYIKYIYIFYLFYS